MLKTEKESFAINDFFVIFDSIFVINENNEIKEIKEEIENKSQNQISDIQNNKKNTDSISQNILDNTSKKSDNTDQEIGEIGNFNTEENNYYNDDIYYDVDSESLINVFDNLDSASKTENNNENNKK